MNDPRSLADHFFFARNGLEPDSVVNLVTRSLHRADGGEFYAERTTGKSFSFSDSRLSSVDSELDQGYGLRFISGDRIAYSHGQSFTERDIQAVARPLSAIARHGVGAGRMMAVPPHHGQALYTSNDPLATLSDAQCISILEAIDAQARAADSRVKQVGASLSTTWQVVTIIRHDGQRFDDLRPMTQLGLSVTMQDGDRRENGSAVLSVRGGLDDLLLTRSVSDLVDDAVAQAQILMCARPGPGGDLPVVIANGWGGVLLHESVGHGLEGDAVYQGASVYAGRVGERVAAPGVTIVDAGNIPGAQRGALHFDDEGHPTGYNVLVEDGILKGYMHDSISARQMGVAPTGNARRQDYTHNPIPRMTATFMTAGQYSPDEIIASVDRGLYVANFAGGQVDPASGKFVFAATEAYLIENGKVQYPVKGAMIQGNGPRSMQMVEMVGNDVALSVTGSCGKDGQRVPVQVGQPTVKMRGVTVGSSGPA